MIFSFVVPVIFAVVFGRQHFGSAKHVELIVVPPAQSQFGRQVVAGLGRDRVFRVSERSDLDSAKKRLRDGKTDAVLAVPARPSLGLTAYFEPNNSNNDVTEGNLQRFTDAMNLRLAGVTAPQVRLTSRAVEKKDSNYYDFLLPGLIAMGVMNLSIIGIAVAVTRFREQQILKRILATPLAPGKFLLAQIGSRLLLSLVQAAIILLVAVGAFSAHVHGNLVWLFLFVALGNIVFLNVGFAIAGRAKTTDSAQALAQLISLPMLFLSGVFFPTSGTLGQIVRALPLSPLVSGLRKISLDGDSITKTWPQLGLLAAWLVISLALARTSFRFDEGSRLPRASRPRVAAAAESG